MVREMYTGQYRSDEHCVPAHRTLLVEGSRNLEPFGFILFLIVSTKVENRVHIYIFLLPLFSFSSSNPELKALSA